MTPRQRQALDFVAAYIAANGKPPTYKEIGGGLGCSYMTAYQFMLSLEDSGYVARGRQWRSLQVLRLPDAA